jgi:hypothetical protein
MNYRSLVVNREELYSMGIDEDSGRWCFSIPVSMGFVDYSEHYEIDEETFERFRADPDMACSFAWACRYQRLDELLMEPPPENRGTAV